MKRIISKRMSGLEESATLKLNARVKELQASGQRVLNLTAGEPDFFVHEKVKAAAIDAIQRNENKYTPVPGIPALREKVAQFTNELQPSAPTKWSAPNVLVSNGAKQAIFNTLLAILDDGDEVLIPSPYWVSYPEMVKIAGGVPKIVHTSFEEGFKLSAEKLSAAITNKTRAIILNSPSNPTGITYSKSELSALGKVIADHNEAADMYIIADEIYNRICFGEVEFSSFVEANPDLQDRTVTMNGVSKSGAMTGWRLGWSVANVELTKVMSKIQGQATSGVNSIAQWAGLSFLALDESEFISQVETFRKRRDLVLEIFNKTGKIKVGTPTGAFYAFAGVGSVLNDGEDSIQFCEALLNEKSVAVVPGTPFGQDDFFRLSYATDEETIREACESIVAFVESR